MKRPPMQYVAGLQVGLALCLVIALVNQVRDFDLWRNYALAGFLIGSTVTYALWRYDVRVPMYIQAAVVIATMAHFVGGSLGSPPGRGHVDGGLFGMHGINGAYHVFPWWDNLTHSLGVGAATTGYAYLFEAYQYRRGLAWKPRHVATMAIICGLATGVAVELYEYLGKTAFQTIDQGGYENTMMDLHFNLIGALAGAGIAVTVNRTAMRATISEHWGDAAPAKTGTFRSRVPSGIAGLLAFVTVPAATSLALAALFWVNDAADPMGTWYDRSLNTLTLASVIGATVYPLATMLQTRYRQRVT